PEVGRHCAAVDDRIAPLRLRCAERHDLARYQRRSDRNSAARAGLGHGREVWTPFRSELDVSAARSDRRSGVLSADRSGGESVPGDTGILTWRSFSLVAPASRRGTSIAKLTGR